MTETDGTPMSKTITDSDITAVTRRFAQAALQLHRLALTADEIQHLPSPVAHREQTSKRGAQDPTATTALDERREAVAAALADVGRAAQTLTNVNMPALVATLTAALNQWDGRR